MCANCQRFPIKYARSIDERPANVASREILGDCEVDNGLSKQDTCAGQAGGTQESLYLVKRHVSNQGEVARDVIIEMLTPYIDQIHTITFDNGGVFAEHKAIEAALGARAYLGARPKRVQQWSAAAVHP